VSDPTPIESLLTKRGLPGHDATVRPVLYGPGRGDTGDAVSSPSLVRDSMFTAAALQTLTFAPPVAYIDGLVLEGLGIMGGRPKLGKSWWCLRAAVTIASGGVAFGNPERRVTEAPVLYLALEDGPGRLKRRLGELIPGGDTWPESLTFATAWPRLDRGGLARIEQAVTTDRVQVVVIDTFARVRQPRPGKDTYGEDTDSLIGLHDLAREHRGLAVWLVHHNRKDDRPEDYIDALSGSTGISGVVDHIAVLTRGRGEADAVVKFTSRDADEHDTAFRFDAGGWVELGDARLYELSKARRVVLEVVQALGEAPLTEIAEMAGRDKPTTLRLLTALAHDDLVTQDEKRGPWKANNTDNSDNTEEGT
jgi:hypothetical protein